MRVQHRPFLVKALVKQSPNAWLPRISDFTAGFSLWATSGIKNINAFDEWQARIIAAVAAAKMGQIGHCVCFHVITQNIWESAKFTMKNIYYALSKNI
jgi:hypothetical protein